MWINCRPAHSCGHICLSTYSHWPTSQWILWFNAGHLSLAGLWLPHPPGIKEASYKKESGLGNSDSHIPTRMQTLQAPNTHRNGVVGPKAHDMLGIQDLSGFSVHPAQNSSHPFFWIQFGATLKSYWNPGQPKFTRDSSRLLRCLSTWNPSIFTQQKETGYGCSCHLNA